MILTSTTLTSAPAGLSITLLCARLNRRNQESKESAADVVHNTLRWEDKLFRYRAEYIIAIAVHDVKLKYQCL